MNFIDFMMVFLLAIFVVLCVFMLSKHRYDKETQKILNDRELIREKIYASSIAKSLFLVKMLIIALFVIFYTEITSKKGFGNVCVFAIITFSGFEALLWNVKKLAESELEFRNIQNKNNTVCKNLGNSCDKK